MIVVQQIYATYGKPGRGGEQARIRGALPKALPLPPWLGRPGYVAHDVGASDPAYVLEHEPLQISDAPPRHGRFLRFDEGMHWRGSVAGMPPRPDLRIEVAQGDWLRVRFNGRHSELEHGESSVWRYIDACINVGRFEASPPSDVFVASEPRRIVDLRAALW